MKVWLIRALCLLLGLSFGYWGVFTFRFFLDVLPHGGAW